MDNDNKEEQRRSVATVATILPTGELVELVYDRERRQTALAVGTGERTTIEDWIDVGDTRLVPWNAENNLIKHEAILLPERPEALGTVPSLLAEIDTYLARYIELTEGLRKVVVGYILLSPGSTTPSTSSRTFGSAATWVRGKRERSSSRAAFAIVASLPPAHRR